jgi:type IV secretory pathway TrbD component
MVNGQGSEGMDRKMRTIMGVAAALCVLALASLVWLHDGHGAVAVAAATTAPLAAADPPTTATGVPSAQSVFKGAAYIAPEEPIAQF